MKKLFACLLAAVVLTGTSALAQQQATAPQPLDRIAAVVDEDVVLRSELDRAINNINRQYAGRENQLPPRDVLERQVLERLVLMKLQPASEHRTAFPTATSTPSSRKTSRSSSPSTATHG